MAILESDRPSSEPSPAPRGPGAARLPRLVLLLALFVALIGLLLATELVADDLQGSERFLCAAREVWWCAPGEGCERVDPGAIGVPDFLEIDLAARELRTTAASGENRRTPIARLDRAAGRIALQGLENERAWSFAIDEASGELVAAVAREGRVVSAFGVCTPAAAPAP